MTAWRIPRAIFTTTIALFLCGQAFGQATGGLEVMSWVPPYAISQSQTVAQADFGACDAVDGLTRVGLQFWVPRTDGTIKYADHEWYTPTDADVAWWRSWCDANGIECLLTIYNNTGSWDWNLARSAFDTNRATFVTALVAKMDSLSLDGIDVDLEGIGSFDADRTAFDQFIHDLWVELDARGKILTVDSFHYIWNAPNHTWWSDWVGEVDNIHAMGYEDLYEGGTGYQKYSFQQEAGTTAGYTADAVLMGMPSYVASWGTSSGRGTMARAHVQEVRHDLSEPTGIAIWDMQLSAWQDSDLWCEIEALKNNGSIVSRSFQEGADGYSGASDTKIKSDAATTNFGSALDLEVDGQPDYSAILRWDVSSIPVGSVVTAAEVTINVFNPSPNDYKFYEMKRAWVESEATWLEYASGQSWRINGADGGGDRGTTPLGSTTASTTDVKAVSLNLEGITLVQSWVDNPATNNGLILLDYISATDGIDFDSREVATVANRPKLTVTYSTGGNVPPTASFTHAPAIGRAPLLVSFDASASFDLDGSIVSYDWDFGDGDMGSGATVDHTYSTPGVYDLTVTVTDDDGATDEDAGQVNVTDQGGITFAIIGDFGDANTAEADVAAEVNSWSPDFILTAGDNNYPDGAASTMDDNVGQFYSDYIFPYTGSYGSTATTNRFFPTLGNHDWNSLSCTGGSCSGAHFDYFTLPGNERYYDFVWGDVHFFAVDSDTREPDGATSTSTQAQWLQAALVASTAVWKIVFFHHAPYSSSSSHGSTTRMQWPFASWGADVVIAGHDHTYERIFQDDIVYYVNGLGGRSIYGFGTPISGSQVRYNEDYGAMRASASWTSLTFQFLNRSGQVVDTYTIVNEQAPQVSASVLLEGAYVGTGHMLDTLGDHLPTGQPFEDSPWFYAGAESVSSLPEGTVDWLLLELRSDSTASSMLDRQAVLLLNDGSIVDTTGAPPSFSGVTNDSVYIVVNSRNHLPIMTRRAVHIAGGTWTFDFTTAASAAYTRGGPALKPLFDGPFGMFAGNAVVDRYVDTSDLTEYFSQTASGASAYQTADFNFDASVDATDFNLYLANAVAGAESQLP